ncbi:MAG TPA: hypothetical protein VMV27_04885 [Candidatus Binataceae bacterium]|nr:hypothetical protein [Candidatus Binataceae bacterium]
MLYIVGGAARAGKTILARRFCGGRGVTHFSIDKLITDLASARPELGLRIRDSARRRAQIIWPALRPIAIEASRADKEFLIEGDALLPSRVAEFAAGRDRAVRACFIGYAHADAEAKLRSIRHYAAGRDDWTHELDDAALLRLIGELRGFSGYLRRECRRHGVAYFDASDRFVGALQDAERYLQSPISSAHELAPQPDQSSLRLP